MEGRIFLLHAAVTWKWLTVSGMAVINPTRSEEPGLDFLGPSYLNVVHIMQDYIAPQFPKLVRGLIWWILAEIVLSK